MKYTRSALGLLNSQYRSVLKKCLLINLGVFALGAGLAKADDFALKAEDLSTSANIKWKEIEASQYDPNNKNMIKVDFSADKSQYFEYTYTQPEGGTLFNTRQEGKTGALSGDVAADFKDIVSSVNGGALENVAGNDLTIRGDFLNNESTGGIGGAVLNRGNITLVGDYINNSVKGYGGAVINYGTVGSVTGNFIGNKGIRHNASACGGALYFNAPNAPKMESITGYFINNYLENTKDEGITASIYSKGGALDFWQFSVGTIDGAFINNTINAQGDGYGSAINAGNSQIDEIKGVFIHNFSKGDEYAEGALTVYNNDLSVYAMKVGKIEADFYNNGAYSKNGNALGGAISAATNVEIGKIVGNFNNNHSFSEKKAALGGAISAATNAKIGEIVGNFVGNYAKSKQDNANYFGAMGGAISNLNNSNIDSINGDFSGNYAENLEGASIAAGGAIYNRDNATINKIAGNFNNNHSFSEKNFAAGGAIFNYSSSIIGDIVGNFVGNYAKSKRDRVNYFGATGGAIYNDSATIESISGDFNGNYTESLEGASIAAGGAIYNANNATINKIAGNFNNNHSFSEKNGVRGGAVLNQSSSTIGDIVGNFVGNYAQSKNNTSDGGVIMNSKSTISTISGDFGGNYVSACGRASGGAINNNNNAVIEKLKGNFVGNYAESTGGAAAVRGGAVINFGNINHITADFTNNHALTNGTYAIGGAVANIIGSTPLHGIAELAGNFSNNYAQTIGSGDDAYAQGGAIYSISNIDDIKSAIFSGNYVSGASEKTDGGAIWNSGTIGFSGNNVFRDNFKVVNGVKTANDIYNSGTINVAQNGSLDIAGGITGDGSGQINLAESAMLNLNNSTVAGNNLILEKDSTLAFNINEINTSSTTQNGGKVAGDIKLNADSNLEVSTYVKHGAEAGEGTYKFADNVDTNNGEWKLNTTVYNGLYNYETALSDDNNTLNFKFKKKEAAEIAQELGTNKEAASEILALTGGTTDNEQFNKISETVSQKAQAGDKNLPAELKSLNDNTQGHVEEARAVNDVLRKNIFNSIEAKKNGNAYGLSGGDYSEYEPQIWGNVLYQKAKNSGTSDFSANTKGVIVAIDGKAVKDLTVGLGYAYQQTDFDSGSTDADMDTHSVFGYAEYLKNSWFVNGLVSYNMSSTDQNKQAFGTTLRGKFDSDVWGTQLILGREIYRCPENQIVRLRPQAGLRYYKISQDGYTDSAGMKYNSADSDILTGVLGVSATDEMTVNNYKVMPSVFVNATYDLQNDDTTTLVKLPNGNSYALAQKSNGKFGVETGIGVEMAITDNTKVGLNYEYDWRDDYSAHTGFLNLKYAF